MNEKMEPKPDQAAVEASDVQEDNGAAKPAAAPEKARTTASKAAAKKKPTATRKKPTAKKQRRKPAAKPVEPPPVPLNREEIVETLGKAKDDFVVAIGEPVMGIVGKYSQMARDTISGAVSGFLGNKKRED